ncbi:SHOCT domain-containing protein [Mycolicibacterium sp. 050158]|uniref:SHOCT domain-containing protein n=1 Tax=Mycolicibacterium sp. 050158 TaxID=3090602 RepID=UPI00299CF617|nr:SHOCT domain-containing protein [Mycolicibacterium sp. 050158]MDX1891230.1 SHOCT domain-containing protein [Mycolicibacterium sp. 050158]
MNRPSIVGLLTIWCVLVVMPAWIVFVTFRGADPNAPIFGPIVIIWIVGYLLQFGVFMVIARKARGNSFGGWLLASTMPFVADWTVPVAPWSPAAVLVVVAAYSAWFYSRLARSDDLRRNGIPATGRVLEVEQPLLNTIVNSVYIRRTMTLRIERSDGTPPYDAKYSGTFMLGAIPSPGDVFNLRVDPSDPTHFETTDLIAGSSDQPRIQDSSLAAQLRQLDDMHRRGALTDAEFTTAKQRLLRD